MSQEHLTSEHVNIKCNCKIFSVAERKELVDIIMGILLVVLSEEVNDLNLLPIIQYISHNLDYEWELANKERYVANKERRMIDPNHSAQKTEEEINATEKACHLILLLLKTRPFIPGLYDTMHRILGNCVGWILCSMVNRYVYESLESSYRSQLLNNVLVTMIQSVP
jgi:hypothetical protein